MGWQGVEGGDESFQVHRGSALQKKCVVSTLKLEETKFHL